MLLCQLAEHFRISSQSISFSMTIINGKFSPFMNLVRRIDCDIGLGSTLVYYLIQLFIISSTPCSYIKTFLNMVEHTSFHGSGVSALYFVTGFPPKLHVETSHN